MTTMSLKIGIVGLPNVGKSTLFNALTKKEVDISNYPFCTIEPNVGIVEVPDDRLHTLSKLSHSQKTIPAVVEFVDIAGLVKGAAEGEGLGNKFLSYIKDVDAIAEVVRVFDDTDIIHVSGAPNPVSDIEVLEYELILKDLETVSRRLESARTELKGNKKGAQEEIALLKNIKSDLEQGRLAQKHHAVSLAYNILTARPIVYIFNISEEQIQQSWQPDQLLKEKIGTAPSIAISAKIESELNDLNDEEKKQYLADLGLAESGSDRLIRLGYETLGLITFFTTGEDETRAWTIPAGSSAPRAGRAIHSDFEEKFIRAEIINWQKLAEAGSWAAARDRGWLRIEGRGYIVQDGDVIEFKI